MIARILPLLFCLMLINPPASADGADEAPIDHDLQGWGVVSLNGSIDKDGRFPVSVEAQPRSNNNLTKWSQFGLLAQAGYAPNAHVSLSQGYNWTQSHFPTERTENRPFQQLRIETSIRRINIINRTRLEERFFSDLDEVVVRGRHQIRLSVPLGEQTPWAVVLGEEVFVNFNRVPHGPRPGFEQSRAFIGLQRRINRHINVEGGYMGQFVNRRSPAADQWHHILLLSVNLRVN